MSFFDFFGCIWRKKKVVYPDGTGTTYADMRIRGG